MKNYPKHIKSTLHSVIRDMAKHPEDFCRRPGKDFTRDRKLSFDIDMQLKTLRRSLEVFHMKIIMRRDFVIFYYKIIKSATPPGGGFQMKLK